MNAPPQITDALEVLDKEYAGLVAAIMRIRSAHHEESPMADATYEELTAMYRKRDQLANSVNNLRAFYNAD